MCNLDSVNVEAVPTLNDAELLRSLVLRLVEKETLPGDFYFDDHIAGRWVYALVEENSLGQIHGTVWCKLCCWGSSDVWGCRLIPLTTVRVEADHNFDIGAYFRKCVLLVQYAVCVVPSGIVLQEVEPHALPEGD